MPESFADVTNDLAKTTDVFDELEKYAGTTTTGLLATVETARNTITGEEADEARVSLSVLVSAVAVAVSGAMVKSCMGPILEELARSTEIDKPGSSLEGSFESVYDYFRDTPRHVAASGDTYDTSASAGASNVGDGNMYRLTVDASGFSLAGFDPDTHTIECVAAARETRRAHDERFEIKGTGGRRDNLDLTGTNRENVRFSGATGRAGSLLNASFDSATFSGSTISAMSAWRTATDGATTVPNSNIEIDDTNPFRTTPGSANSYGVKFTGDETLYQDLTANNQTIDADQPYLIGVRARRNSSATGTLELRLSGTLGSGGVSVTLDVSTLSADTYGNLIIPIGANCWPENWNLNDLKYQLKMSSLSGSVTVDDCALIPMFRFGQGEDPRRGRGAMGQYVTYWGGATPSVRGDTYTFTDSESTRSAVNYWLRKGEIGYLPEIAAATEVTAAGGRTLTFADADPDTITASTGDFTSDGFSPGMKLTVAGTSSNNGTFVIATVTATVITLEAGEALAAEGPLSATATLNAVAYVENP